MKSLKPLIALYLSFEIVSVLLLFFVMKKYDVFSHITVVFILIVMILLTLSTVWYMITAKSDIKKNNEAFYLKQQAELMKKHENDRNDVKQNIEDIYKDINSHISKLCELDNSGKYNELTEYIATMSDSVDDMVFRTEFSRRQSLNAALCHLSQLARKNGVRDDFIVSCDDKIDMPDLQLCIIILNLTENAIEAASKSNDGYVSIRTAQLNEKVIIKIENSAISFNSKLTTTKQSKTEHGLGIGIVKSIIRQYGGDICFDYDGKTVTCVVSLSSL